MAWLCGGEIGQRVADAGIDTRRDQTGHSRHGQPVSDLRLTSVRKAVRVLTAVTMPRSVSGTEQLAVRPVALSVRRRLVITEPAEVVEGHLGVLGGLDLDVQLFDLADVAVDLGCLGREQVAAHSVGEMACADLSKSARCSSSLDMGAHFRGSRNRPGSVARGLASRAQLAASTACAEVVSNGLPANLGPLRAPRSATRYLGSSDLAR